jgi:hypothetical protein
LRRELRHAVGRDPGAAFSIVKEATTRYSNTSVFIAFDDPSPAGFDVAAAYD